jgi:hypothetical protein
MLGLDMDVILPELLIRPPDDLRLRWWCTLRGSSPRPPADWPKKEISNLFLATLRNRYRGLADRVAIPVN